MLIGCATGARDAFVETETQPVDPGGMPGSSLAGDKPMDPTADAAGPKGKTVFYAHTNKSLFRIDADDPRSVPEKLGDFDCLGGTTSSLTDLAIDESGKLYGLSERSVFLDMKIEGDKISCSHGQVELSRQGAFFGASFAPKGVLASDKETLVVADSSGALFSVDTTTGELTKVGSFGNVPSNDGHGHDYDRKHVGKAWELSGDIVFLANAGKPVGFATVRDCPSPPSTQGCNNTDTLIEIDLKKLSASNPAVVTRAVRGMITKGVYCKDGEHAGYGNIYGLTAYEGILLGFSRTREQGKQSDSALIVRIENKDGAACLVSDATDVAGTGWAGAGVTTLAPITDPDPK